jgi:hypothetical protein
VGGGGVGFCAFTMVETSLQLPLFLKLSATKRVFVLFLSAIMFINA